MSQCCLPVQKSAWILFLCPLCSKSRWCWSCQRDGGGKLEGVGLSSLGTHIKENKYLSLTCDSSSLSMRKIYTTQRTVSLSATNPPNFHCSRIMLVLERDAACQILFPQVPHEGSCKALDLTCKKNWRNPNLWDLHTACSVAWGKHCALLARSQLLQHQENRHRLQKSVPNPPAASVWVYRFVCLRASPNQGRGGNLQSHLQNYGTGWS